MNMANLDQTHPDIVLDDIDLMALKEFLGRLELPHSVEKYLEPTIRFRGDIPDLVTFPPGNMKQAVPRNFTVLLFGREPHRFFRGAYAILSVYQGLEKDSDRSVRFEIFGPIPVLIRNLVEKLQLHMGLEIDKTADFLNGDQNRYRFSKLAVQEAIVNAFVHRDYHSYEPVRVTVFKDRIEVTSPGGSIANLDAEQIQKGEVYTSWRNPSLAWFMVELKYAQNEGQGIRTIIQQTRKIAGKDPQFKINSDWFTVVIPAYAPIPVILDFDLKVALSDLRVGLDELRDTLSGHEPELEKELDKVEDSLNQVTGESSKEKFNKPLNDLRRLLKRLETPVSASLINSYNQLASWITGIPLLPDSPSAGKDIHI